MASPDVATTPNATGKKFEELDDVVIRFAGDSGDGGIIEVFDPLARECGV